MKQVVATASLKRMRDERRKLRQWQAAQLRAKTCPSLDDLIAADPENERAYIEAFKEAFAEVIDEDPFFSAFEETLEENPDADPEAIITLLELAYPFEALDEPDEPMPRSVFVAPAVIIRRRSCGTCGRRSSGNRAGSGKGGGDGGSNGSDGDGDSDDGANFHNAIKINARALDAGIGRCILCIHYTTQMAI